MKFIEARDKAYAESLEQGYHCECYARFDQDEFGGWVIFPRRRNRKQKPRMVLKVYSEKKLNKNGKCLMLRGEETKKFLEKYM
jgi:hypothetical protein